MSKAIVQPYLFFNGNCEEAIEFYRKALGAEVEMMMRFKDSPEPPPPGTTPEGWGEKIMHATFHVSGATIMASDGCGSGTSFSGFSLSFSVQTEAEAEKAFNALSDGGIVMMPLEKTFWSPKFGMLTDRFGVAWMVNVVPADQWPSA